MTAEFAEYKLAELCVGVFDCPHSTPYWASSGTLVLRNYNVRNGRLDLSEPSFTDEAHYRERIRRAIPESEDIVITREAPMGEVAMIPNGLKCCLGQRMVLLKPNRKLINPRFLLYALQGDYVQDQISWSEGSGTTVSNLRIPDLCALKVLVPSHHAQDFIANLLGTIDDRIALNEKLNAALEAAAAAVFKSWFVDFDPVVAKSEGRKPFGMTDEIATLFPDRFDANGLPEGWKPAKVRDLLILSKQQVNPMNMGSEFFEHYSIPSFDASQEPAKELGSSIKSNKFVVPSQCILVSKLNPSTPRVWWPQVSSPMPRICSTEFMVAVPKTGIPLSFCYAVSSSAEVIDQLCGLVTGTSNSHQRVKPDDFLDLPASLPPGGLLSAFDEVVGPLYARRLLNQKQNRALRNLRDAILPGLVSGELQIRDVEREIAGVAG